MKRCRIRSGLKSVPEKVNIVQPFVSQLYFRLLSESHLLQGGSVKIDACPIWTGVCVACQGNFSGGMIGMAAAIVTRKGPADQVLRWAQVAALKAVGGSAMRKEIALLHSDVRKRPYEAHKNG